MSLCEQVFCGVGPFIFVGNFKQPFKEVRTTFLAIEFSVMLMLIKRRTVSLLQPFYTESIEVCLCYLFLYDFVCLLRVCCPSWSCCVMKQQDCVSVLSSTQRWAQTIQTTTPPIVPTDRRDHVGLTLSNLSVCLSSGISADSELRRARGQQHLQVWSRLPEIWAGTNWLSDLSHLFVNVRLCVDRFLKADTLTVHLKQVWLMTTLSQRLSYWGMTQREMWDNNTVWGERSKTTGS